MMDFFPKLAVHEAWMRKMRKHFKAFKTSVLFKEWVKDNKVFYIKAV